MYAKIFRQIYDGTLSDHWQSLVTFQQLLILADEEGVVDMTPAAIHRVTGIPQDIIDAGLERLAQDDSRSRTPHESGRRIVLLDADRPWGWRIVNYLYYRNLANKEDKREKDRQRIAEKRAESRMSQPVAECGDMSPEVANVAHTEAEADTNTERKKHCEAAPHPPDDKSSKPHVNGYADKAKDVLEFLNESTGSHFRPVKATLDPIVARLKSGATTEQCKAVIVHKWHEWHADDKMRKFIRPSTLFRAHNFEDYLGQLPKGLT